MWKAEAALRCRVWASHRGGFSGGGPQALGARASVWWHAERSCSCCSTCGTWAQLFHGMWNLPRGPEIKPLSPALAGRFFTTEQYFSFRNGWNKTQDGITCLVIVYGQHLDKCNESKGDGHTPKITANRDSNKNFSMNVHRSTIHNSPKVEIIWMSINRWMNKQNVAHSHNEII